MTDREQTRRDAEELARAISLYVPDGFWDEDGVWHDGPHRQDALRRLSAVLTELEQAERRYEEVLPLVASLAIYGERVNIAALVAKARALNEAQAREQARSD